MNKLLKLLFYLCLFSIILGPMGALPLGIAGVNVYLTDVFIGLICLIWIARIKDAIKLIRSDVIAKYFLVFVSIAIISLVFSPININIREKLISGLYIVRLFSYFFVYLTTRFITDSSTSEESRSLPRHHPRCLHGFATPGVSLSFLASIGLILAALGWLQYFLYPDLRNLFYLGWDPHFKRIFSTYFDPNYFGLLLLLSFIALFFQAKVSIFTWFSGLFIFVTLMFTYSRSTYLSLLFAGFFYSWIQKKYRLLMIITIIMVITVFLLPRPGGEGVKLERVFSIEQRLENWREGIKILADYPLLGIGFNAVRYAKRQYGFTKEDWLVTHSGAGFENSFLFVLVTTGIGGLIFYLLLLRQLFMVSSLATKASLVAIIIHSFFLNSLFFPWVILWLWILIGINSKHEIRNP